MMNEIDHGNDKNMEDDIPSVNDPNTQNYHDDEVPQNVPRFIVKGTRSTYYDYIGGLDSGAILKDLLVVADKLTLRVDDKTPKYLIQSQWFDVKTGMICCPMVPDEATFHYLLTNKIGKMTKRVTLLGSKDKCKTVNVNWKLCCAKAVYKDFDVSEIDDAYAYIDGGQEGSETTLSDLKERVSKKPNRFISTSTDEGPVNKKKAKFQKSKTVPKKTSTSNEKKKCGNLLGKLMPENIKTLIANTTPKAGKVQFTISEMDAIFHDHQPGARAEDPEITRLINPMASFTRTSQNSNVPDCSVQDSGVTDGNFQDSNVPHCSVMDFAHENSETRISSPERSEFIRNFMSSQPSHASLPDCRLRDSHSKIMAAIKGLEVKVDLQTRAIRLLTGKDNRSQRPFMKSVTEGDDANQLNAPQTPQQKRLKRVLGLPIVNRQQWMKLSEDIKISTEVLNSIKQIAILEGDSWNLHKVLDVILAPDFARDISIVEFKKNVIYEVLEEVASTWGNILPQKKTENWKNWNMSKKFHEVVVRWFRTKGEALRNVTKKLNLSDDATEQTEQTVNQPSNNEPEPGNKEPEPSNNKPKDSDVEMTSESFVTELEFQPNVIELDPILTNKFITGELDLASTIQLLNSSSKP